MPCYTLKTVAVDQENFAVKIISRSRSTAKIKHAKNKITWRWSLNKLARKSTLHEVNVRSTTTAEVTWPTSNTIPIITYFSSLSLCMMRWLSVGSHDPQQRSHDPPVIQSLSPLTLVLSLSAWWGHCRITWPSAEVTWPTSNTIPIITYFSSLSLCMMRWLSVGILSVRSLLMCLWISSCQLPCGERGREAEERREVRGGGEGERGRKGRGRWPVFQLLGKQVIPFYRNLTGY